MRFVIDDERSFWLLQKELFQYILFDEMNSSIDELSTYGLSYFREWIKNCKSIKFCYINLHKDDIMCLSINDYNQKKQDAKNMSSLSFLYRILKNIIEEGESLETISVCGNLNVSQQVFEAAVDDINHKFIEKNKKLGVNRNYIKPNFEEVISDVLSIKLTISTETDDESSQIEADQTTPENYEELEERLSNYF